MEQAYWLILVGIISLILIPLIPKLVAIRVRVLRFFHWYRLADWHERNAGGITMAVRILLAALAAYLLVYGIREL